MTKPARSALLALCFALMAGCGEMRISEGRYYLQHTVQPGETLYSIAWRYGYDHREVASWNDIEAPYRIYPGQELLILGPDRDQASTPESNAPGPGGRTAAKPHGSGAGEKPPPQKWAKPVPRKPSAAESRRESASIHWQWPTTGKIIVSFAASKGRKGIDVSGKTGQPVLAAADGEVVYSGNGLIGYGNLVIIKHDDVFLSAYAHNRRLLVKEGEKVRRGASIAEMGQTPKGASILHFEIRRNGKPVDPLLYLPNHAS